MKKFLKVAGILVLVLLVAIVALPFAFKGKIKQAITDAANDNLTAVMAFDDVSLSLIRSFPNLTVSVEQLSITGTGDFEGVPLVKADEIIATVDVWSLLGDTIALREIRMERPTIDVRVLADGKANYDIAKADTTAVEETPEAEASSGFAMKLKAYSLNNASIVYDDATFPMRMEIEGMNHSGSGDFTLDVFTLSTATQIERIDVVYDGIRYLRDARADLQADLEIDNAQAKYTFKDNALVVNRFPLKADGWVAMPTDDIDMDISFSSAGSDLVTLLSLVPAEFAQDLSGVSATGKVDFNGFVRGTYNETTMPGFAINLNVDNGRFNYPDLPESVENIAIDLRVDASKGIDNDAMTIDLDKFYMEIAKNPIAVELHVKNPYTDPMVDCDVKAKVDFDKLKEVVPLEEGDQLTGSLIADARFKGRVSALDEERYDDVEAGGELILLDTRFASDSLPYTADVSAMYLKFSPAFAELTQFEAQVGETDLSAQGRIDNIVQYALRDELLTGNFQVRSKYLNINAFMGESSADSTSTTGAAADSSALSVIRLPENVDFTLGARFDKMLYDDLTISNASGTIVLRDGRALLDKLGMELLGGSIVMDGSYDSKPEQPLIDMEFAMKNMDIQQTVNSFYTIEKMAPIAKSTTGKFTTTMSLKGELDSEMMPVESTLSGGGRLQTAQVHIEKFEPLNKLASELGIERLAKQTINDLNLSYRFENGRIVVDPFTVKLEGIETTIDGSMSFSQALDYNVKMTVPLSLLPGNIENQASALLQVINDKLGSNVSIGTKIPVVLKITGTVDAPVVNGNFGDAVQRQKEDLKEQIKETVKEAVEEKLDEAREEAIAKARAEADKIIADAQKQANNLVAEATKAADNVRNQAYAEAQKVEDSAKNPLERAAKRAAADKLRQEADKARQKAIDQAQKQADKAVNDAKTRADAVIQAAEKP